MDEELLELLNRAKDKGATKEQLITIRDSYLSKKKSQNQEQENVELENTTSVSTNIPLVSKETQQDGALVSQPVNEVTPTENQNTTAKDIVEPVQKNTFDTEPIDENTSKARSIRTVARDNGNGSVSTVLMATETFDGKNWFSFPTLFPKDPKNVTSNPNDWIEINNPKEAFAEAQKRNEVFDFGTDKEKALAFGEGSWKPKQQKETLNQNIDKWNERINTNNTTQDLNSLVSNAENFKKNFVNTINFTPREQRFQEKSQSIRDLRAEPLKRPTIEEPLTKEEINAKETERKAVLADLKDRKVDRDTGYKKIVAEKQYSEKVTQTLKENDGSIDFLTLNQIRSTGVNPSFLKTSAIKVNGEETSVFDLDAKLLDGAFVEGIKNGDIKIEIDKNSRYVDKNFIPKESIEQAESLLERQKESGSRIIGIGEHLASSISGLPSTIMDLPIGLTKEAADAIDNPILKKAILNNPFYLADLQVQKQSKALSSYLEERTQLYGDGVSRSFSKGRYLDGVFQLANETAELAPVLLLSVVAPEAAPFILAEQAAGGKLTSMQEEQRLAKESKEAGNFLNKDEQNALKYNTLQRLKNTGMTGVFNYFLMGGYIKSLNKLTAIEAQTGKNLSEIKDAMNVTFSKRIGNFGKEIAHQEAFFAKSNAGSFAIDKATGVNSNITGETVLEDAIKGVGFAVPFYGIKSYNNNKVLKDTRTKLVDKLLTTSRYTESDLKVLDDISTLYEKTKDNQYDETSKAVFKSELRELVIEAEKAEKEHLKGIEGLSKSDKLKFAERYEGLIQRQNEIDKLNDKDTSKNILQEGLMRDKKIFDDIVNESIGKKETTTKPIKSDFDNTIYDNKTGALTPLGEEIKQKIENGEDVTILTAREDTQENRDFIARQLGISPDKIKLGLSPNEKAANVNEGDVFYDDNQANIDAVNAKFSGDNKTSVVQTDTNDITPETQTFESIIAKEKERQAQEKADIEKKIPKQKSETINDVINRPVVLTHIGGSKLDKAIEGDIFVEGKTVVVEDGEGVVHEIGNIDKIGSKKLADLGVEFQKSNITVVDGKILFKEKEVVPSTDNPMKSIKTNRKGNVNRVVLREEGTGNTITLRGADMQDAAYQILLKEAERTGKLTERKLSTDEEFRNELRQVKKDASKKENIDTKQDIKPTKEKTVESKEVIKEDNKPNVKDKKVSKSNSKDENENKKENSKSDGKKKEVKKKSIKITIPEKKTKDQTVFYSGRNSFNVKVVDGKLEITPVLGNAKPTPHQIKTVTKQYAEKANFDKGERADFEGTGNSTKDQQNDFIAENSKNAVEVAVALNESKKDISNTIEALELTKEDAIAQALNGKTIEKSNRKHFTDLSAPWKFGNKKTPITLDRAREVAQEILGKEVDINDIIEFVGKYKSIQDYTDINKTEVTSKTDALEIKFEELTGLKPTTKNVKAVIGENKVDFAKAEPKQKTEAKENTKDIPKKETDHFLDDFVEGDSEVPFQTESEQTSLSSSEQTTLANTLMKSGFAKEVKIVGDKAISDRLKELGRPFKETPLGFVDGKTVYINKDKAKADSLIHEFGELWVNHIEKHNKNLYEKGVELIKESDYYEKAKKNNEGLGLTERQIVNDALSQAIGEGGVEIQKESKKKYEQFQQWFKQIFKEIVKGLGIRNMTGSQLANLSLKDFTRRAGADLLAGKKIGEFENKQPKNKIDNSPNTGIEFLMAQETAVRDAKDKLTQKIKDKNSIEKDAKKEFLNYLNETIKRKSLEKTDKSTLNSLLKLYDKTVTESNLNSAIKKIDEISKRLDEKEYKTHIGKLKARAEAKEIEYNKRKGKAEKRTAVKKYLKEVVKDKKWFTTATFNNIIAINNAIESNNIGKALESIDKVAVRLETRYNIVKARNETLKRNAEEKLQKLRDKIDGEKDKFRLFKGKVRENSKEVLEVKKAILYYINDSFDNKILGKNFLISDLKKLLNKTKESKPENLSKVLEEVDEIVVKIENKTSRQRIDAKLTSGTSKQQAGKEIAGTIDEVQAKMLLKIKELSDVEVSDADGNRLSNVQKDKIVQERIDKIQQVLAEIKTKKNKLGEDVLKQDLTESELNEIYKNDIALSILAEKLSKDAFFSAIMLKNIESDIDALRAKGKHILLAKREADNKRFQDETDAITIEGDALDVRNSKEVANIPYETLAAEQESKYGNALTKLAKNILINPFMRNLGTVSDVLKKVPSLKAILDGAERLLEDYNFSEVVENEIKSRWIKEIDAIKSKVFGKTLVGGKRLKADFELSRKIKITKDFNGLKRPIKLTESTLLNAWMKNKDPLLADNLAKNGYTPEVLADIDSKLSKEAKEYGEEIIKWFVEKYPEVNEAYKARYYHNLPFNQFYSGMLSIEGNIVEGADLFNNAPMFGTINAPNLKTRTKHSKAILDKDVDANINQYVNQMSRFIAYSDVDRRLTHLLNDDVWKKTVVLNNKADGRVLIEFIKNFQDTEVKKINKNIGSIAATKISKTYVGATLALKPIQVATQMVSGVNGQLSLPKNMTAKEHAHTLDNWFSDLKFLVKYDEMLRQRYESRISMAAFSGIDDVVSYSNNVGNAKLKIMLRMMTDIQDNMISGGLKFTQVGDFLGVMGVVPVFTAYKARIAEENPNMSKEQVIKEAMLRFNVAMNNGQQPQTKGTKSNIQRNAYGRLLTSFATTPVLNMNEAAKAARDLNKNKNNVLSKNKSIVKIAKSVGIDYDKNVKGKPNNTTLRNIKTILNYGVGQQLAYVATRAIILNGGINAVTGGIDVIKALFDDEDDEKQLKEYTEEQKDVARTILTGGMLDLPMTGLLKSYFDFYILDKEHSFGKTLNIPVAEIIFDITDIEASIAKTTNPQTLSKLKKEKTKILNKVLIGFPNQGVDFIQYYGIIMGDNVFTTSEKLKFAAGSSFSSVNRIREKRTGISLKELLEIKADRGEVNFTKEEAAESVRLQDINKEKKELQKRIKSGELDPSDKELEDWETVDGIKISKAWVDKNYNIDNMGQKKAKMMRQIKRGDKTFTKKELFEVGLTEKWQFDNLPSEAVEKPKN